MWHTENKIVGFTNTVFALSGQQIFYANNFVIKITKNLATVFQFGEKYLASHIKDIIV